MGKMGKQLWVMAGFYGGLGGIGYWWAVRGLRLLSSGWVKLGLQVADVLLYCLVYVAGLMVHNIVHVLACNDVSCVAGAACSVGCDKVCESVISVVTVKSKVFRQELTETMSISH